MTDSTRCRSERMSFVEGVRDSSLEFNMLSSSGFVGVFVRVGVNCERELVEGIW